jgi:transposase InsO family protein
VGIHHSTYYRWRAQVLRYGLEVLTPREQRAPRMPNAISPMVEQRVLAFALGHPGLGPNRIAAELARPKCGGIKVSANGVWRVLRRHGLNTRAKRLGLVAGYAAPAPEPVERDPQPQKHLDVDHPGQLVQMDCFCVGRLTGTRGVVWQYTAIDVASPTRRGWRLEAVMTDHGAEFKRNDFDKALAHVGARHVFIRSGRPQTNGCVERVQGTILEECWKPTFARYLIPKQVGLRHDLERYLRYYNNDRAHTGRWTRGRTPTAFSERPRCGRDNRKPSQQLGGGTP